MQDCTAILAEFGDFENLWFIVALLVITVILVTAFDARGMPDLEPWHTTALQAEFRAGDDDHGNLTLGDYLRMERALFEELDTEVLAGVEPARK